MSPRKPGGASGKPPSARIPVKDQVSAGGVVYRKAAGGTEVVLIAVGADNRWQLPKGLVDKGEQPELAAAREAREEGGVTAEVVQHIETVEYWFVGLDGGARVRFHKKVHFYLMRYISGETSDHDWEVNEARWLPIDDATAQLAFDNERRVMKRAAELIDEAPAASPSP